nr:hypothetical protein [Tanacetum cinerariifolium]
MQVQRFTRVIHCSSGLSLLIAVCLIRQRPPMLDRADFTSWQQRIRLYCQGKENEEGALHLGLEQGRVFTDLSPEEKDRYNANIRATNILLRGLPKDIYTLIDHYTNAKDIWDNVKMLLESSELIKDDHKSQLYDDDFKHFRQNKGETIHDYYVRFTKLINDMQNIKMTMPRMQLNLKFVKNMLSEWGRFVTAVTLKKGLKDLNYDQLYAYLKQHEAYANENKMMLERFTQHTVDPLALIGQGNNLRGACAAGNGGVQNRVGNANLGQARHNLALNVDNVFQADESDAFNSDVDEAPTAQTMFMANLSSAIPVYDEAMPSYDSYILSKVHEYDNYQDAVSEHHEVHEMHHDIQPNCIVDANADYTSDSNMIPYDQLFKRELSGDFHSTDTIDPEQIFWSKDTLKIKAKALKEQNKDSKTITTLTVDLPNTHAKLVPRRITPTGLIEGERGFEQTKECYLTEVILFFKTLKEHFEGIQKALTKEIKEMKEIFEELEVEVDQHVVNRKYDEIEPKNLLIPNDNLIADCLSKEVFYVATNSELIVNRFSEMHDAYTTVQARCLELKAELSKLKDKIQKDDHDEIVKHFSNLEKINVPVIPSIGLNSCPDVGGSKPRSNTKKNMISPAKSVNKKKVEEHPRTNKSSLQKANRVDYSISSKRTDPNKNWRSNFPKSLSSSVFKCRSTDRPLVFGLGLLKTYDRESLTAQEFHKKFIGIVRFGNDHFGAIMGYGDYVIGDSVISMTISVEDMMKFSLIFLLSKASKNKSWLWHRRLNHLNFGTINDLARKDLISSGLVPNPVPTTPYVPPTNKELEILFQLIFDEYLEPPRVKRPVSPTIAVRVPVISADTPSSTTIDQDAPSPSHSPSSLELQPPISHQGFAAGSFIIENNPFAIADNDPFVNVFALEPSSEASSSGDITLKWIYKVKLDEYEDVLKNNDRLVAKGYRQEKGIDFEESFCIDCMHRGYKNLHRQCRQQEHNHIPDGCQDNIPEWLIEGKVYAPRAWYDTLLKFLLDNKFSKGAVDPTLFTRKTAKHILLVQIYEAKIGAYSFKLDEDWFTLDTNLLRKELEITPIDQAYQFESSPSGDAIMDFVNQLGYPGEIHFISRMAVNNQYQPWRAILLMIIQCLTGKTSGFDRPKYLVPQMLWGIVTRINVDNAKLLWKEFIQAIQTFFADKVNLGSPATKGKKTKPHVIPYCRFTKLIICHLGRKDNLPQIFESLFYLSEEDIRLRNLKFVLKGEDDEFFRMKIPKELITDDIRRAPYYRGYL